MSASDLAIVAALVFAWGTLSARLERFDVTAPIIFVAAGLVLTHGPLAVLGVAPAPEAVKVLAEVTLVLVLFSDASRVGLRDLRGDLGLCLRLLGVGLPLTIGLGTLLALVLFGGMNIWLALLVGAALAPADAALGAGVMLNRSVPARISRLINVESGLNDGIATPFVLVALAGAGTAAHEPGIGPGAAVAELALGLAVGVAVGGAGGWLVRLAGRRGWAAEGFAGAAVLGLAVCAYASAVALHGNGFIAAFVGGLAFRGGAAWRAARTVRRGNRGPGVAAGLARVRRGRHHPGAEEPDMAARGVRGVQPDRDQDGPGRLALAGAGLSRRAAAFIGWFGPRGLASVVFALLALEDLGEQVARPAVTVIAVTVLSSVIAHGASAEPLARRYGPLLTPAAKHDDPAGLPELPTRRLVRRAPAPGTGPAPPDRPG